MDGWIRCNQSEQQHGDSSASTLAAHPSPHPHASAGLQTISLVFYNQQAYQRFYEQYFIAMSIIRTIKAIVTTSLGWWPVPHQSAEEEQRGLSGMGGAAASWLLGGIGVFGGGSGKGSGDWHCGACANGGSNSGGCASERSDHFSRTWGGSVHGRSQFVGSPLDANARRSRLLTGVRARAAVPSPSALRCPAICRRLCAAGAAPPAGIAPHSPPYLPLSAAPVTFPSPRSAVPQRGARLLLLAAQRRVPRRDQPDRLLRAAWTSEPAADPRPRKGMRACAQQACAARRTARLRRPARGRRPARLARWLAPRRSGEAWARRWPQRVLTTPCPSPRRATSPPHRVPFRARLPACGAPRRR